MTKPSGLPPGAGEPSPSSRADPLRDLAVTIATQGTRAPRDAVRALVTAVGPAMLRAVRKVLGPAAADVEDVMQESIEGFLQALGSFKGGCTVLHFACRVAVLSGLATRRRASLRAQWTTLAPDLETRASGDAPSPTDQLLAAQRRESLRMILDELSPVQAEALVLHCALGFSIDEIAASVGCPGETVRSRLRLAKQTLRERIGASAELAEILEITR